MIQDEKQTRAGIVLLVLWSVLFLSMLAVACSAYIRPQLSVAMRLNDRSERISIALAGIRRTMWDMSQTATGSFLALDKFWTGNCGRFSNQAAGSGIYTIYNEACWNSQDTNRIYGLVDEERKLNVNTASETMLRRLVSQAGGVTSQQAARVAASIVGARNSRFNSTDGSAPTNAPFASLEELLLINEVNIELFERIAGRLTVYGRGTVNINTADHYVLRSAGASEELIRQIAAFLEDETGGGVFSNKMQIDGLLKEDPALPTPVRDELTRILDVRSDSFSGRCVAGIKGKDPETTVIFVFGIGDSGGRIKYWREY